MKKALSILLAFIFCFTAAPIAAIAQNGPSKEQYSNGEDTYYHAYITAFAPDENGELFNKYGDPAGPYYTFFGDNEAKENVYSGITYNRESNELIFDSPKDTDRMHFDINMMGDDFKIRVNGTVNIGHLSIWGYYYGGNLTITGDGVLTVNQAKDWDNAIVMYAEATPGKLTFSKDVKVNLYGNNGPVVKTTASTLTEASNAIVFENGQKSQLTKSNYTRSYYERVNAIFCNDPEEEEYGGKRVASKSDSEGIYTVSVGWRGDDEDNTLYWIKKFVYVPEFNAYVRDDNYFKELAEERKQEYFYGELEMTEEEWLSQDEYSIIGTPTDEPAILDFQDEELFGSSSYNVAHLLNNADDPDAIYGYATSGSMGGVRYYDINRFIYDSEHKCYVIDSTYKTNTITEDELNSSKIWSIKYGVEEEWLNWTGSLMASEEYVYTDYEGKKYLYNDGKAYQYEDAKTVALSDGEYYLAVNADDSVDTNKLNISEFTETMEDLYNFNLAVDKFFYTGNGNYPEHTHQWSGSVTTEATCSKAGVITYTCSCGKTYTDAIPATGKHISDNGTVTKKATPTEVGEKVYKCTVCGQVIKTETIAKAEKYANTLTVKAKKPTVKFANLKKKNQTIALKKWAEVSKAQGKVTYKKSKGNKKITVAKNGKITVKKGLKKGTYKIKIKVTAAGNATYKAKTKTVTVTIKVK